ncbi:carboxylesterase/lipase family protein [Corynebacterium sp. 70RC1]|uniref:carboxylesterase/lipase family protein n=2 Tax=unclassified Corynebacterium TaxID=2624378 RepID=UPI00211C4DE1|nr:carboxylesterase/lipase family protein [Corynebacterium sp. 70RC1]
MSPTVDNMSKRGRKVPRLQRTNTQLAAGESSDAPQRILARTTAGLVAGVRQTGISPELSVRTWRGVPYGETTTGERRFAAPRPAKPWPGVRECTEYGEVAAQPILGPSDRTKGGEDCLHLDVVRPDSDEVLPVVVYFHGGSFMFGSSHELLLRGHYLATGMNVVYVSLNFRLGVLGYLDFSSMAAPGDDVVANPAVLDQLLALRWIQANIAAFGGDPENVTIMGESAGAAAVLTLMCVPAAKGMFHRCIAQSPPIAMVHSKAQAAFWTAQLRRRLGLGEDATVAQLREMDQKTLINASQSMLWRSRELFMMNSCYGPTVDGKVLFEHPLEVFRKGQQHPVPLLIGTNYDEASFAKGFYLRQTARGRAAERMLAAFDPEGAPGVLESYEGAFRRKEFALLIADAVFWAPAMVTATYHQLVANTWMYRFDFAPAVWRWLGLGAMHSMELTPVFGDLNGSRASAVHRIGESQTLEKMRELMQGYWGSFIHHGTPGGTWPRYRVPSEHLPGRATMVFDREPHIVYDPKSHKRRAWLNYTMTQWGLGRPELLEQFGELEEQGPKALPPAP